MSTNTKKKHGTGAAVVLIVLCLLALGTLGYIIWRQFNPVVPETAAGYVAAAGTTAPVYDENGTQLGSLVRGAEVQYVAEDAEDGADRVRVVNGEGYAYLDAANLTAEQRGADGDGVRPAGHEPDGRDGRGPRLRGGKGHGADRHRL